MENQKTVRSRKLEILEARLYRISENQFPEWERWRMVDRAQDSEDRLISFTRNFLFLKKRE